MSFDDGIEKSIDKNEWIPIKDKEPTEYGEILCTNIYGEVNEYCYHPPRLGDWTGSYSTCVVSGIIRVEKSELIAWMPMPEPYEKNEEM